jgi:acyl dehydratase
MSDEGLITDEMRAAIGRETEPSLREVDRTQIRLFARSVGHTDQIYYDVEAAKAAGYRDLPAPPGYLGTPVYQPGAPLRAMAEFQPSRPLNRRLNGGTEIEYYDDIVAGDVLTATSQIADFVETKGSIGPMLVTTTKTVYKNQDGKVVAIGTGTGIRY